MKIITITGRQIDSTKESVYCVLCGKPVTNEQLDTGDYFDNGGVTETGAFYSAIWHKKCAIKKGLLSEDI